jgi:hypothetical protein
MQIVTLNNEAHRNIRIDTEQVDALGAHERMVPVVLDEFLKLVVHYPILLTKSAETGRFLCVALLGFAEGENLFWNGDAWQGIYTPLNLSRQPFFLGQDKDHEMPLLCIDAESPCVTANVAKGEPLFTEQGKETGFLSRMKRTLAGLAESEKRTRSFTDVLQNHDLIVPLSLDITFADESSCQVKGLYTVDEDKLNQLPQTAQAELFAQGHLKSIYTMIASLGHIYSLIQRKNDRLATAG